MKKIVPIIFLICLITHVRSQKINFGLEFNVGGVLPSDNYYGLNAPLKLNAFGILKKHEIYAGFSVEEIRRYYGKIFGLEAGYKYHFYSDKHKSNFLVDLNLQISKHAEGCVADVKYNYKPDPIDYCISLQQIKSRIIAPMFGYELFYTKWLSTLLTIGPGLNFVQSRVSEFYPYYYGAEYSNFKKTTVICLIKASIRFTF